MTYDIATRQRASGLRRMGQAYRHFADAEHAMARTAAYYGEDDFADHLHAEQALLAKARSLEEAARRLIADSDSSLVTANDRTTKGTPS